MKNLKIIVLSGVSGVGKSSVIQFLINNHNFGTVVSTTTREKREGEKDGVNYHFISKEKFQDLIDSDSFIEWTEFADNRYGIQNNEFDQQNKDIILDVDLAGYKAIKQKYPSSAGFFLINKDMDVIVQRLCDRQAENTCDTNNQSRIKKMQEINATADEYDYVIDVTGSSIEETADEILNTFI